MNYKNFIAKCMKLRDDWGSKEFWLGNHFQRGVELIDAFSIVTGNFTQLKQASQFLSATLLEYRMRFNCMMKDGSVERFFAKQAERNKQPQEKSNEKHTTSDPVGGNGAV